MAKLLLLAFLPLALAWNPVQPPMTTPWSDQVSVDSPWPEYPRPQMTRPDWQNLNGIWDFEMTGRDSGEPGSYSQQIRVPFPVESALSGVHRRVTEQDKLWYKRTFTVPSDWNGRQVQLHFGAADWETNVWINGQQAGDTHRGGYDSFTYDITGLLNNGDNTIVVSVWDPTDAGTQACGKQRLQDIEPHPGGGIWYTPASGIWQTVWLEPTPAGHITRVDSVPNLSDSTLRVTVQGEGINGETAVVTVSDANGVVGTANGNVGAELSVKINNPRLWSPDDPYLYDVNVQLVSGSNVVDSVDSYAGMRSVAIGQVNGIQRILLNGQFVFQTGTLDQGFWPDGIYTAPTDDALKFDIQKHKDLGFNMLRKHIKVEMQRWFYWADHLGLLVWQDMPAMAHPPDDNAKRQWEAEYLEIINEHRSSPALILYVDENEGWGQYDQSRIAQMVKDADPSRLVDNMSGVNCCGSVDGGNGDVIDNHIYVGVGITNPTPTRAGVLGEYGGLGLRIEGHEWSPGDGFSYEYMDNTDRLNNRFVGLIDALRLQQMPAGLSASVYTEITDLENEINGLLTYDRQVVKVDQDRAYAANKALIEASRNIPAPVTVPTGLRSIRVTTPGFTDHYIRHQEGLAYTAVVTAGSDDLLKNDATWNVVQGLANSNCYSFESKNYRGEFLRHSDFRVRRDPDDGSELFRNDATWCPVPGSNGARFMAKEFPGQYLRHYDSQVYLAVPGGAREGDQPTLFTEDTTWEIVDPWAP